MKNILLTIFFLVYIIYCSTCIGQDQKPRGFKVSNLDSLKNAYIKQQEKEASGKRKAYFKWLDEANPDSVSEANLKNLLLSEMPDLSVLHKINLIDGSGNHLIKIPRHAISSDSLRKINFSDNELTRFRTSSGNKLVSLKLSNNQFKRMPRSIRKAKNLKYLNLANNQIKRIPRFVKNMDSLAEINLNYNQIKFNNATAKRLANINTVMLAGNNLAYLPENIGEMTGVRKLNFSKNKLNSLPESFKYLENLTNVIFYQNEFNEIPAEIFYLKNLIEVDFYYNKIETIPEAIVFLVQLKQLFLSFNQINKLPDAMKALENMRYLYIHHNNISAVPAWITQYSKLERLDLSYNKIFVIPDLSNMPALTEIDMQENEIEYFPWSLLDKPNLRILVIKNNPFILNVEERRFLESFNKSLNDSGLILVY